MKAKLIKPSVKPIIKWIGLYKFVFVFSFVKNDGFRNFKV